MNSPAVAFSSWHQVPAGHQRVHVGQERHREVAGGVTIKAASTQTLWFRPRLRPASPQAAHRATQMTEDLSIPSPLRLLTSRPQATAAVPSATQGLPNPILSPEKSLSTSSHFYSLKSHLRPPGSSPDADFPTCPSLIPLAESLPFYLRAWRTDHPKGLSHTSPLCLIPDRTTSPFTDTSREGQLMPF